MKEDIGSIHRAIDIAVSSLQILSEKSRESQAKLAEAVRQAVLIISHSCIPAHSQAVNLPRRYAIEKSGRTLRLFRRVYGPQITVAEIDLDVESGENDSYGDISELFAFTRQVCTGLLDDILDNIHKQYMDTAAASSSLHNESIAFLRELYDRYWGSAK